MLAKGGTVLEKYLDFANVFWKKSAEVLPKHTKIHKHLIKLQEGKQLPASLIYNLELVELEILKIYIKTNLANGFIQPSKSPIKALICFIQKLDGSLHLCVNYQGLNNLTIKNRYPLLLIEKSLN